MFGNLGSSGNGRRVEIPSGGVKIFEHRQEYLHPTAQKRCGGGPGPVPQKTVKILVEQRAYGTEKSTDIR